MRASEILCHSFDFDAFVFNQKRISFAQYQSDVAEFCAAFEKIDEPKVVLYIPDDLYLILEILLIF